MKWKFKIQKIICFLIGHNFQREEAVYWTDGIPESQYEYLVCARCGRHEEE